MDGSAAQKEYRVLWVIIRAAVVDGTNDGTGRGEKKLVQFFLIRLEIIYDWLDISWCCGLLCSARQTCCLSSSSLQLFLIKDFRSIPFS